MAKRQMGKVSRTVVAGHLSLMLSALAGLNDHLLAQTVISPVGVSATGGALCSGRSAEYPVSIRLPPAAVIDKVDVFFLFDDTGSFAGFVPTVTTIFSGLVGSLETALPSVSFGFGVGRFEDYGGPGTGFSGESPLGRPFTLNQPIVTAATTGSAAARDALIATGLANTAPGGGGDGPESALEGLNQVATGSGFDGDGNGSNLDSGPAGALATQTTPGTSGDVPAYTSNTLPTSGTLGGSGWRSGALHLVILATDICPISAVPSGAPIPGTITGAGSSFEPVTVFACSSTSPGVNRFGYVSDAKTTSLNTVSGAVAPRGAATVQGTVNALNGLGIRVLGMGPGAAPTTASGPSSDESVWLSALARLTGAVDGLGNALVFSTSVPVADLSTAIVDAIATTVTLPVDVSLSTTALPAGLSFTLSPTVVTGVAPGGTAAFTVTLTGDGTPLNGAFDINFVDVGSGAVLGTIPATLACPVNEPPICSAAAASPGVLWPPNHQMVPISITGVTDPDGNPITITATSISQDETVLALGEGSDRTSPDASLDPIAVRSERNGNPKTPGDGRVYHVAFTANDGNGGLCSGVVKVCVPHDRRPGAVCVDGGPLYNSIP
jgi:hypothetical protein